VLGSEPIGSDPSRFSVGRGHLFVEAFDQAAGAQHHP